jgi:hypothetical protein
VYNEIWNGIGKRVCEIVPANMAGFFVMAYLENLQQQLPQLYHHELPRGPVPMLGVPDLVIYPGTSSGGQPFSGGRFPKGNSGTWL